MTPGPWKPLPPWEIQKNLREANGHLRKFFACMRRVDDSLRQTGGKLEAELEQMPTTQWDFLRRWVEIRRQLNRGGASTDKR